MQNLEKCFCEPSVLCMGQTEKARGEADDE
jgi:hypothetical protein